MRLIPYKRLNMYYKHRVSMLYNMASDLIIHERIRTTLGKARSLAYLMNNFFKKIAPMDTISQRKAKTIVRIPLAYKKLMNGLVEKYRNNMGGVVRIVRDPKVRLNDNSQMAYVEFLDNKTIHEHDKYMQYLKEQNNYSSYLNWEIFLRERELASYNLERERRQNLYSKIQKTIVECREESKQTKEKLEFLIQEKLFGDADLHKLNLDYRIPPQHLIQFYLKATKPEELELFFKDSEYYLTKLIRRTNQQLEYLHYIKSDVKKAQKYERRNYLRFLGSSRNEELSKQFKEKLEYENTFENHNQQVVLRKIQVQNNLNKKQIQSEIKILKAIDDHIKANKYNKFNLTAEQKQELNKIRKAEMLCNAIKEKTIPEADLLQKHKESQGDSRVYFYKNNQNSAYEGFDLRYNQKMHFMLNKDSLGADMSKEQISNMTVELKKMDAERKLVGEILKRKKVEDSLRRKKKYHLPDIKRMKTSLDKYDDEDQYYLVKSFKESGIDIKNNFGAKRREADIKPDSPRI